MNTLTKNRKQIMHKKTRQKLIQASNKNIYLWLELMMAAHERDLAYRRLIKILRGRSNETG